MGKLLGLNTSFGQLGFSLPSEQNSLGYQTSLKLDNIFNTAASIVSQVISAKSRNPNTQILNQGGQLVPIQPQTQTSYGTSGQVNTTQYPNNLQPGGVGAGAVNTGAGFIDGMAASFGISTGTFMLLSGVGLYLLFRPAPGKR
jgi:hypothetical protein